MIKMEKLKCGFIFAVVLILIANTCITDELTPDPTLTSTSQSYSNLTLKSTHQSASDPTLTSDTTLTGTPESASDPTLTSDTTLTSTPQSAPDPTLTSDTTLTSTPQSASDRTLTSDATLTSTPQSASDPTLTSDTTHTSTPQSASDPTLTSTPKPSSDPVRTDTNNYTSVSFTSDTCNYTCSSPPLPPNCEQIEKYLTDEVNTTTITLSYKSVCIIPENAFIKYNRLERVIAKNNKIYIIELDAFQGTHLHLIDLTSNLLTMFPNLSTVAETLVNLNLANNKISVIHGVLLQNLQKLQYLNLVNNDVKVFNIDNYQVHLSALNKLYIHQNYKLQLSKNFAIFFINLTLLSLSGNCLQHKHYLPRFIERVEFWYCNNQSYDALKNISTFYKTLDHLKHIKIQGEHCEDILDDAPRKLTTLDISFCDLGDSRDFLHAVRTYSKNLTHLVLKRNHKLRKLSFGEFKCNGECREQLTGSDFIFNVHFTGMSTSNNNPNGIICNCTKNGTIIENFNISQGQLQAVEHLDLTYNAISEIDSFVLSGMCSLVTLSMSHNDLSYLPPLFNSSYSHNCDRMSLGILDLSHNKLTLINGSSFTGMYSLKKLFLHNNYLRQLQQLTFLCSTESDTKNTELKHLQHLDVSYNRLEFIDPMSFEGLYELTELILNNNNLTALPPIQNICSPTPIKMNTSCKLEKINLHHNKISEINSTSLDGICFLKVLLLSNNLFRNFPEFNSSTCTVASVRQIDLNDNLMTTMDKNSLKGMINLQDLRIGSSENSCDNPDFKNAIGNTIDCIGNTSDVAASLENLYYSNYNPSSNISRSECFNGEMKKLKNLKELFVKGNGIKDFPDVQSSKNTLSSMSITGTSLLSCPDGFLSDLDQCTSLDVCNNRLLRHISSISGNPVLKTLNLKGNKDLTVLPDDISSVNRSLQILDLSGTSISNMSLLTPASLSVIKEVRLQNMNIKQLPPYLSQVQSLTKIDLSHSEVTCSCDLAWLKPGLFTGLLVDEYLRCSNESMYPSHPWKYFIKNVNDCNFKNEPNEIVQDEHNSTTVSDYVTTRRKNTNFSLHFDNHEYYLTGETFEAPYAAVIGSFEVIIMLLPFGMIVALDISSLNTKISKKCTRKRFNNNRQKLKYDWDSGRLSRRALFNDITIESLE